VDLHILNGDCLRGVFEKSGIRGETHVLREMLPESPFELNCDWDDLFEMRAEWLQKQFGIPADEYLAEKESEYELIDRLDRYDDVCFWFDSDLFCQLNLIYALSWFTSEHASGARLHLVRPGMAPDGRMQALSRMTPAELHERLQNSTRIQPEHVDWADAVLIAYGADTPLPLWKSMRTACSRLSSGLPDLRSAVDRLFRLYPSVTDGTGWTERLILDEIRTGDETGVSEGIALRDLQRRILSNPDAELSGMTDLLFYRHLRTFTLGAQPLITVAGHAGLPDFAHPADPDDLATTRCCLTKEGRDVLAGRVDRLSIHPLDRWIGGVHLSPETGYWRFDGEGFIRPV